MESAVKPPSGLASTGNMAQNWKDFELRFDIYLNACGATGKTEKTKTCILLNVIGEEWLETYQSFEWETDGDQWKLDKVKEKLKNYCTPQKSITTHRENFFKIKQQQGQNVDQFAAEIRNKAKHCEFGSIKASMCRDRLIYGLVDTKCTERLLEKGDTLTFEEAVKFARDKESTKANMKELGKNMTAQEVHQVKGSPSTQSKPDQNAQAHSLPGQAQGYGRGRSYGYTRGRPRGRGAQSGVSRSYGPECDRCGYKHAPGRTSCPAIGQICRKCERYNHFAKKCLAAKQTVHSLDTDFQELYMEEPYEDEQLFVEAVVGEISKERNPEEGYQEWTKTEGLEYVTDSDKSEMCTQERSPENKYEVITTQNSEGRSNDVEETEKEQYTSVVDSVDTLEKSQTNAKSESWVVPIEVNGTIYPMKLDTGSNVNILSYEDFKKLERKPKLCESRVKLTAYAGNDVPVKGQCILTVKKKGQEYRCLFIVSSLSLVTPILGLPSCEKLDLIRRVYEVNSEEEQLKTGSEEKTLKTQVELPDLVKPYEGQFKGLGCLPGLHKIRLKNSDEYIPVVEPCRKVPFALYGPLKEELDRMEQMGVIVPVNEPTEWVNSLIIVHKKNGSLRICMDPKNLNKAIRREHFKLPSREEIMAKLAGAKVFSKLDASSGFWQMRLDEESSLLCTFITPFGRYRYTRLPMGVCSAPEVFHRELHQHFEQIPGCETIMDDIIVWGKDDDDHDANLLNTLKKGKDAGITYNLPKCLFKVPELTFIGDTVSAEGMKPDPAKVKAIVDLARPTEKTELQRFLGMVNYQARYIPDLSERTAVLRQMLKVPDDQFVQLWSPAQEKAWKGLKKTLTEEPVLKFYDPEKNIIVSSDASQSGIGAVLKQNFGTEEQEDWYPVAYASRALSDAETRYATIEKETLAITFACERFQQYVYGQRFVVETDHKPLESIFKKSLGDCPPRIQRFRLRLQKYDFSVKWTPGKNMYTADALSRNVPPDSAEYDLEKEVSVFVHAVVETSDMSQNRLQEIKSETQKEEKLRELMNTILHGWPASVKKCPPLITEFWNYRDELSVLDGVIYKGQRIVIPQSLRPEMLRQIHAGHLGEEKCRIRARQVIFWPGMNTDITLMVKSCDACLSHRNKQQKEPMQPHTIPAKPWAKISTDLFKFRNKNYLLLVDYYSNFPEVCATGETSKSVIGSMKSIFARNGIAEEVISDNGPCYDSQEFRDFSREWGFVHNTSSPRFPQSNGLVEKTVQTVKNLFAKCEHSGEDPYMGLLAYRSTPLEGGKSPAYLLNNRHIRSNLPMAESMLQSPETRKVANQKMEQKMKQKKYFDRGSRPLKPLNEGETVRVRNSDDTGWQLKATVLKEVAPRSYLVKTERGSVLRRNRKHLLFTQETPPDIQEEREVLEPEVREETPQPQYAEVPQEVQRSPYPRSPVAKPSVVPLRPVVTPQPVITPKPTIENVPQQPRRSGRIIMKPRRLIEDM